LEEIIFLQDFLEHQEAANASPSQEDLYFLHKDYKLIASLVQELWCSKVELPNPDIAVAICSSRTLDVKGSDKGVQKSN
jgi:hypothetical protein